MPNVKIFETFAHLKLPQEKKIGFSRKMVNHTFDTNYDANDTFADHLRLYGDCISSACRAKETPDDLREFEEDTSSYIWYFLAGLLLKLIVKILRVQKRG